jgi:biopolymer transport protein TolR
MRKVRKPINQINVVPYIDVMLVLLVIFMVTAPLVSPGEIELPSVGSKLTVAVNPLEIQLGANKSLTLIDKDTRNAVPMRVTRDELVGRILDKQKRQEQAVVIVADKAARYEDVIAILDLLQRNGVRKVGLLARPAT